MAPACASVCAPAATAATAANNCSRRSRSASLRRVAAAPRARPLLARRHGAKVYNNAAAGDAAGGAASGKGRHPINTPLLDTVNVPIHLKNMSIQQLEQLSKELREETIHSVS